MKLTEKDAEFLMKLRRLVEEQDLRIELTPGAPSYLVLRQNYGDRIEGYFGLSRQGVRWRFQRLFSDIYVEAYSTILWVESNFGTDLRKSAMRIAKEKAQLRQESIARQDANLPQSKDGR